MAARAADARWARTRGTLLKSLATRCTSARTARGVLLAGQKGSANRLGYICAHTALIVICLGGLLD